MCVCMCAHSHMYMSQCMWDSWMTPCSSQSLPSTLQGLNWSPQAWRQVLWPAKASHQPVFTCFFWFCPVCMQAGKEARPLWLSLFLLPSDVVSHNLFYHLLLIGIFPGRSNRNFHFCCCFLNLPRERNFWKLSLTSVAWITKKENNNKILTIFLLAGVPWSASDNSCCRLLVKFTVIWKIDLRPNHNAQMPEQCNTHLHCCVWEGMI